MTYLETTIVDQMPPMSLEQRRDTLYSRLDAGFDKIEQAQKSGLDVSRWEEGWQRLLTEYEEICDQIARRPVATASL
ncbi:MAG: hypothetical protein WD401_03100 [Thermomicrobiaceae bacterium]